MDNVNERKGGRGCRNGGIVVMNDSEMAKLGSITEPGMTWFQVVDNYQGSPQTRFVLATNATTARNALLRRIRDDWEKCLEITPLDFQEMAIDMSLRRYPD